jgi:hypothetical protein
MIPGHPLRDHGQVDSFDYPALIKLMFHPDRDGDSFTEASYLYFTAHPENPEFLEIQVGNRLLHLIVKDDIEMSSLYKCNDGCHKAVFTLRCGVYETQDIFPKSFMEEAHYFFGAPHSVKEKRINIL